ncbi:MAG: DUF4926 domain-containing protein [Flavobacterium psychrophilum]|nr:MAG: DUF4926 domain-containing protein [Flavobacterium psychrophilum]
MIKEYDIIKSIRKLSDKVPVGTKGTVLMIYDSEPTEFEIEFVNDDNKFLEVLTVVINDVVKIM